MQDGYTAALIRDNVDTLKAHVSGMHRCAYVV